MQLETTIYAVFLVLHNEFTTVIHGLYIVVASE